MTDPFPLRTITADDYPAWVQTVSGAFGEDMRDADLEHERSTTELDRTIGAFDGDTPVSGAGIYSRSLTIPGGVLPIAAVTWVGVAPTHRRRGILTSMMRKQLTDLHESGREPVAALYASEALIYGRFGYGLGTRHLGIDGDTTRMAFRPGIDVGAGRIRFVDKDAAPPILQKLYDEVRGSRPGWLNRRDAWWDYRLYDEEHNRHGATARRFVVHEEPDGSPSAYAFYRLKGEWDENGNRSTVQVGEVVAATPTAYAAIWRFLTEIDLHPRISCHVALDEPLTHLLLDARSVRQRVYDGLWVRVVDVDRALAARRYSAPLDVVLEVDDPFCPWNAGRYRLRADGDVTCERTQDAADVRLTPTELGAAYLGGTTIAALAAAGRVTEVTPGAVARCSAAFRGEREPFCPEGF